MTAESIIIIIGGVLLLLSLADSLSVLKLINLKLRIPLGISGLLLLIYGGYAYGAVNLQGRIEQPMVGNKLQINSPIDRVQVISPLDGDSVKCRVLTMGVYPENNQNDIWVLLRPTDNRYYPQSDHTNTSYKRNQEWQVITRFGGSEGEIYELNVYETDAEASAFFSATIEEWKKALSYPGLKAEELPKGAVLVDRISVALEGNCRGVF